MPEHDPLESRLRQALGSVDGEWEPTAARRVRVLSGVHHRLRRRQVIAGAAAVVVIAVPVAVSAVALSGGGPPSHSEATGAASRNAAQSPGASGSSPSRGAATHPSSAAGPASSALVPPGPAVSPCGVAASSTSSSAAVRVVVGSGRAVCAGVVTVEDQRGLATLSRGANSSSTAFAPTGTESQDQAVPSTTAAPPVVMLRVGERLRITLPSSGSDRLAWTAPTATTGAGFVGAQSQQQSRTGGATAVFVGRRSGTVVIGAAELERCSGSDSLCGTALATYQLTVEVR